MSTPMEFMSRVVPWPGPGEAGYINIHWRLVDQKSAKHEAFWSGRAFTSLSEFMNKVKWGDLNPTICRDIYYCTSLQSKHGKFSNGNAMAARSAKEALSLKAIWLDIDVKEPPKGYSSLKDAARAALLFAEHINISRPTAFVATGGGLHVYWISDRALSVDEWRSYAEGLKKRAMEFGLHADHVCTADAARILRVPGTHNFKEFVPREVRLAELQPNDIDFAKEMAHLAVAVTATVKITAPSWAKLDPGETLADPETHASIVLDWQAIEAGCPFFKNAKANGGKEDPEPLWSLALLSATFFENGDVLAHELSNQHPDYTVDATDIKYRQKLHQRGERKLGWPSCAAFQTAGCLDCAGCPHFGKIKSPLSLGVVRPAEPLPEHVNSATSPASKALRLPPNGPYFVDEEGIICEMQTVRGKKGEPPEEVPIRLFLSRIKNPRAQSAPDYALNFDAETDLITWERVKLTAEDRNTQYGLLTSIGKQGVLHNHEAESRLRGFFLSWIKELNTHIAATKTRPFGWIFADGKRKGFSFGGTTYYADGHEEPASVPDSATKKAYEPVGTAQPWFDALNLILDQKRPHLEILAATAFATPILWTTGGTGGTFGAWSESGSNKTSALTVALAVWGDPLLTKLKPNSTHNFIENKIGNIDCLPLVIDDAQKIEEFEKVIDLLFDATAGVNKGRLKQDATSREQLKSRTSIITTANNSYHDFMVNVRKVTDNAGLARMLEMYVPMPGPNTPGRISQSDAERILSELEFNHGVVGVTYAKWLVENLEYVQKYAGEIAVGVETAMNMRPEERFWKSFVAAIIAGAHFADKALGVKFDIVGITDVLFKTYKSSRAKIEAAQVSGDTPGATEGVLSAFISRYFDHQLYTETLPNGRGKPIPVKVQGTGPKRTPVMLHWSVDNRVLRITKRAFIDFLVERKYNVASVMSGLEAHFKIESVKARLGGGTMWSLSSNWLIEFRIDAHHFLEPTLFQQTSRDQVPDYVKLAEGLTATVTPPVIETGLVPATEQPDATCNN